MNANQIINELSKKYPGKKIIRNKEDNPTEIICEIDPAIKHPERSFVIAVIDKSEPHYHKETTETYEVAEGELMINRDGKEYKLKKGDKLTIKPEEVHYAIGNETWVKVYSKPGWIPGDHILIKRG